MADSLPKIFNLLKLAISRSSLFQENSTRLESSRVFFYDRPSWIAFGVSRSNLSFATCAAVRFLQQCDNAEGFCCKLPKAGLISRPLVVVA